MTSEPTRKEHDAMTTLDRNRTTFSEPSEPSEPSELSEPKDDEMPDDELSVVDVLKSGFPSGHTAAAFVIYGSLVFVARSLTSQSSATQSSTQSSTSRSIPRAVWLVPLFLALLVAVARVDEGVHYPNDVAAGLLLGAVVAVSAATGLTDLRDISARTR